jgi:hypothetical protein
MAFQVLLHLWCFKERLHPPQFRTTIQLTSLIILNRDKCSQLIREGLEQLGMPVWSATVENENPPLKLYP